MPIAVHSHALHEHEHSLPHQGMWFLFMLTFLLMLLTEYVTGAEPLLG